MAVFLDGVGSANDAIVPLGKFYNTGNQLVFQVQASTMNLDQYYGIMFTFLQCSVNLSLPQINGYNSTLYFSPSGSSSGGSTFYTSRGTWFTLLTNYNQGFTSSSGYPEFRLIPDIFGGDTSIYSVWRNANITSVSYLSFTRQNSQNWSTTDYIDCYGIFPK